MYDNLMLVACYNSISVHMQMRNFLFGFVVCRCNDCSEYIIQEIKQRSKVV